MNKYYDQFSCRDDLASWAGDRLPPEEDIIFAGYTYEDYSGSAIAIFRRDGKLYEVNDGHCSCNGLETWDEEETSPDALLMRKGWGPDYEAIVAALSAARAALAPVEGER